MFAMRIFFVFACLVFFNFTLIDSQLLASEKIIFLQKNNENIFFRHLLNQIQGKDLCFITNQSGTGKYLFIPSSKGYATYLHEILASRNFNLYKVFSPEHGLSSQSEANGYSTDMMLTGNIPVFPAYDKTSAELKTIYNGCDTVLFDLPDAGIRPYTYRTILSRTIEAIHLMEKKPVFYLIDQPNPASFYNPMPPMVSGEFFSYLGEEIIPFFPGYTYAELARYFIFKKNIHIDIKYIAMLNYNPREKQMDKLTNPMSPSLPHDRSLKCYWISIFFEGTALDQGRFTKDPFCLLGHPAIEYKTNPPDISGIVWKKTIYKPFGGPYQGILMRGYEMQIENIDAVGPAKAAYMILQYFFNEYPQIPLFGMGNPQYKIDRILGSDSFRKSIEGKRGYEKWQSSEQIKIEKFIYEMQNFKIY